MSMDCSLRIEHIIGIAVLFRGYKLRAAVAIWIDEFISYVPWAALLSRLRQQVLFVLPFFFLVLG